MSRMETDIDALVARAGPPSPWSNPAYDGIAITLRVPGTGITLLNSRMRFAEDEPFFAAAAALATAANEVAVGA